MIDQPSSHLHFPGDTSVAHVQTAIDELLGEKNYPCVPALASLRSKDYMIGVYGEFGSAASSRELFRDLMHFRNKQKEMNSLYASFFAVFFPKEMNDEEFETGMWRELSALSAEQSPGAGWDPNFSQDPADPKFCLSLEGEAYFVVGMHPGSSRQARRFRYPAIVFNLYEQFEELSRRGQYEAIVETNRKREMKYAGSLNPMVVEHGDKWEAIQFSGRDNPSTWKCPFHHGAKA